MEGPFTKETADFSKTPISDIAMAAVAAEGLFKKVTITSQDGSKHEFLDKVYPIGLIDPMPFVLEELPHIWPKRAHIESIISIGSGRPSDNEIGDLLRLGVHIPAQASNISSFLARTFGPRDKNLQQKVATSEEIWLPKDVTDYHEREYRRTIMAAPLDRYRRIDIASIQGVGPNDFLSFKEISDITYQSLNSVELSMAMYPVHESLGAALIWAACTNNVTVAQELFSRIAAHERLDDEEKISEVNHTDKCGRTPLYWAVKNGHKDMVDCLLQEPDVNILSNVEKQSSNGNSPTSSEDEQIYNTMSKVGKQPKTEDSDTNSEREHMNCTIGLAIESGRDEIAMLLVRAMQKKWSERESFGIEPEQLLYNEAPEEPWPWQEEGLLPRKIQAKLLSTAVKRKLWLVTEQLIAYNPMVFGSLDERLQEDLLTSLPSVINQRFSGTTLLALAISGNDTKSTKVLLHHNAESNQPNIYGETLLYLAAKNKNESLVKALLDAKADPNLARGDGETPLHIVCHRGYEDIARLLLGANANISAVTEDGETALHRACQNRNSTATVKLLLEAHANPNLVSEPSKNTALHMASFHGQLDAVQLLLRAGADVQLVDKIGNTALHMAAEKGHHDVASILLRAGIDSNITNKFGTTALHQATNRPSSNGCKTIQVLLDSGADIDRQTNRGLTAIYLAIERGKLEEVRFLLDHGADVGKKTDALELFVCAATSVPDLSGEERNHRLRILEILLQKRADFLVNQQGETPLHRLAELDHVGSMERFLEVAKGKLSFNEQSYQGNTALHVATQHGHWYMVDLLLKANVDSSIQNYAGHKAEDIAEGDVKRRFEDERLK